MKDREPEFDRYAERYEELLKDPVRDRFAGDSRFYVERKWAVLKGYLDEIGQPMGELRWLDVGCGKGDLLRLGRGEVKEVAGCDFSTSMMAGAGDLGLRVQQSATALPYEDGSFDLVTAVCVYHHVAENDRLALTREVARVLMPGGIAAIVEHNPRNPVTRGIVARIPVDVDARLLRAREAQRLLAGAGLEPMGRRFFLYVPQRLWGVLGWLEGWLGGVGMGGQYVVFGRKGRCEAELSVGI